MHISLLLDRHDLKEILHRLGRELDYVLKARLTVPGVAVVVLISCVAWVIAGVRLRGMLLLFWLLVPLLVLFGAVCVGGPGHFISKRWEGRSVFRLAPGDAVTTVDLLGLAVAGLALILAAALILWRLHRVPSAGA